MRLKSMECIAKYSIVIVVLGLLVGCGEDNSSPVIISFTASITEVATNAEVDIVVLATDLDGDELTYTYQSTGGTISGTGSVVIWIAPAIAGNYTITVDISDGELRAQSLVTITVVAPEPKAPEGMVLIPAGEFEMGTDLSEVPQLIQWAKELYPRVLLEANSFNQEMPCHTVYLDAYYIDIYEVTNALYGEFMDATGYKAPVYWDDSRFNAPDQPVVGVSWFDAEAYAEWAGKQLPTEAEWEKAARGGLVGKKYTWGNSNPDGTQCNFSDKNNTDSIFSDKNVDDGYQYTAPVGSFPPNDYGLYDMAGNVVEWCADWEAGDYYANSPQHNPTGPSSGEGRVMRGGNWYSHPITIRVANRSADTQDTAQSTVGFRCVIPDGRQLELE